MRPNDIKAELVRQQKTAQGIADILDISRPAVSQVIAGVRSNPRIRQAIAEAIGLQVSEIWPDAKTETEAKQEAA